MRKEVFESPMIIYEDSGATFNMDFNKVIKMHCSKYSRGKKVYTWELLGEVEETTPFEGKVFIHYEVFRKNKVNFDIDNFVSIHKKFFQDTLQAGGAIIEDNYKVVVFSSESFGGINEEDPHVRISVMDEEYIKNTTFLQDIINNC